jgi:hypothetical protein
LLFLAFALQKALSAMGVEAAENTLFEAKVLNPE